MHTHCQQTGIPTIYVSSNCRLVKLALERGDIVGTHFALLLCIILLINSRTTLGPIMLSCTQLSWHSTSTSSGKLARTIGYVDQYTRQHTYVYIGRGRERKREGEGGRGRGGQ